MTTTIHIQGYEFEVQYHFEYWEQAPVEIVIDHIFDVDESGMEPDEQIIIEKIVELIK